MKPRKRNRLLRLAAPVAFVFGTLLLVTAAGMLLPIGCALIYDGEGDLWSLVLAALITAGVGAPLRWVFRGSVDLEAKSAFFIATFGWVVVSAFSALPFVIHGTIPSFTDAFFEMMSGYTTTGSTILTDIEVVPHGLLLWRSETHFIGGMGFVTLAALILPHGMGGLRLFRAESSPGQLITKERFTARNRDAMRYLWAIYTGVNAAEAILLCAGGMSLFDSLCHTFGTVSTSGYSPYNASISYYDNAYFDWVIVVFMLCGGTNFVLFYHLVRRDFRRVFSNTELRWYAIIVVFFCASTAVILFAEGTYGFVDSVRYASFQVVSLMTTTGFTTADYEQWPNAAQMFLYAVCFVGPCTGSTGSGIKIAHFVIIWKFTVATIRKNYLQPLSAQSVRMDGQRLDPSIIGLAVIFFMANIFFVLGGGMLMSLTDEIDVTTAMSSVIATLMNIGPGFGGVGPTQNFAFLSDAGKWFLSFMMLIGRLEMYSALVLFYPSFWRE